MSTHKPPYKGGNNVWRTTSLFYEPWIATQAELRYGEPLFSLTGKDGFIDARSTFVALEDPTGYSWAIKYLASWQHFEYLMEKCKWFRTAHADWCEEIKILQKSRSILRISEIAQGGSPQALQAAKYLASAEWEKGASGRGRPSREEVSGELRKQAAELSGIEDDARRIGLTVIAGGKA